MKGTGKNKDKKHGMEQGTLFHEDFFEALKACVTALGGSKVVGHILKPELSPHDAADWLRKALTRGRREVLNPEQVLLILKMSRQVGCHTGVSFIATEIGYAFQPIEPEDEKAALQRQAIQAIEGLKPLLARLEKVSWVAK